MPVSPYLQFNGNCAEAIALYEKAFGVKASALKYSDAPKSEGYAEIPGTENYIMHAKLCLNGGELLMCDMPPEAKTSFSSGIAVLAELKDADAVKAAFAALQEGGEVGMEPQEVFWTKCFSSLKDKFGVDWMIAVSEPQA